MKKVLLIILITQFLISFLNAEITYEDPFSNSTFNSPIELKNSGVSGNDDNRLFAMNNFYDSAETVVGDGQFDVRFVSSQAPDCSNSTIYYDIEVRASNPGSIFNIAEQNYRFTFDNTVLANPSIEQELFLSGFVGTSFYSIHNLTGGIGNLVSYNVVLAAGPGYLLDATWTGVGRLAFDIIDDDGCFDLTWKRDNDAPKTYISEKIGSNVTPATSGIYEDLTACAEDLCPPCPAAGTVCNDNDPNTTNDVEDGLCNCAGTVVGDGQFDVRLVSSQASDCSNSTIYYDIEVRASNPGSTFNIAEQNYRFTFDTTVLANPVIEQELFLSGLVGTSVYSAHNLIGGIGNLVSYNVELAGGPGYTLDATWTGVGRLAFDIIDDDGCFDLIWKKDNDSPKTFISEKIGNYVIPATSGIYEDLTACAEDLCPPCPAAGTACNDNDPDTTNDIEDGLCNCAGTVVGDGQFDVRLVSNQAPDCGNSILYYDIEVRASNPGSTFNIAEQNYRFTFDTTVLANPAIEQELFLSGLVGTSVYSSHNLIGGIGNLVSYNVELAGGSGYTLGTTWTGVGRLAFDIIDDDGCFDLIWKKDNDSPKTFISEKIGNYVIPATSGIYEDLTACVEQDICPPCPAAGTACNDNDPNTTNDVEDGLCNCAGTIVQNPQFNIRLISNQDVDCDNNILYYDIEIRAANTATVFNIAEQNYRFNFDTTVLANPSIEQELFLSSIVGGTSLYGMHTLTGGDEDLVSYNVELASGPGYLLDTIWTGVGRLAFDIIDEDGCFDIKWNTSNDYPPTFIASKVGNDIIELTSGTYENFTACIEDLCTPPTVDLCLFLEGAYDNSTDMMTNFLETRNALPQDQPYDQSPWNYSGSETVDINQVVDWVLVSFRTSIVKADQIAQAAGLLTPDGCIHFTDAIEGLTGINSPLYIVVEHRNHMGIMTPQTIPVSNKTLTYDFRVADSYVGAGAVGKGQKEIVPGIWAMLAGDIDQTDIDSYDINGTDKAPWSAENGSFGGYFSSDLNLDADANGADKILWNANNGIFSSVPK